jgi:hypothetical protein
VTPESLPTAQPTVTLYVPTPSPGSGLTPFPTWTPLPTTPPPAEPGESSLSGWLTLVAALHGLVLVLGIPFILRREPRAGLVDPPDITP